MTLVFSNKKRPIAWLAAFILLLLLSAGCSAQGRVPNPELIQIATPKPVILDVDMAHEDMHAALFLLAHPNVTVRAITVVGTGEAHCGPGVENALGIVAVSGKQDVPVSCGRETPLAGDHEFPAEWRQDADQAYGVEIPDGGEASALNAPDLIASTLKNAEENISIVAVGPLTNIAGAIEASPEIVSRIDAIYIMGGAVEVDGNVGLSGVGIDNPYAEWNIYIDPKSANIVLGSGAPIVMVPLDATGDVPVTRQFYGSLEEHSNTASAKLVFDMLTANLGFVDSGGFQFWDSLTAAIFADEGIASYEDMTLMVVEEDGPESGYTRPSPDGYAVQVAVSADQSRFEQLFLTILNWESN
jgi:pyrimidine-specific ribonucleoside hydrolase